MWASLCYYSIIEAWLYYIKDIYICVRFWLDESELFLQKNVDIIILFITVHIEWLDR